MPAGELGSQPGHLRGGGEHQGAECSDGEAVQGFSRSRPHQPHQYRRDEHEKQATDGHAETVAQDPGSGDAHTQSDVVRLGDHRARQEYPSDAEADAETGRRDQGGGRDVAIDVGLLQVDQEQQRQSERGNGDQCGGQAEQGGGGQGNEDHSQTRQERQPRSGGQMREKRTDDVRPQQMLTG